LALSIAATFATQNVATATSTLIAFVRAHTINRASPRLADTLSRNTVDDASLVTATNQVTSAWSLRAAALCLNALSVVRAIPLLAHTLMA